MNILMLTPYLPYPLLSGGQIRTYNLLKQLADKHNVTLFALIKDDSEEQYIPELEKFCHKVRVFRRSKQPFTLRNIFKTAFSSYPFLVMRNYVSEVTQAIRDEMGKNTFDLLHAETFYMMPHLPKTKTPTILVEQTIEYLGYESYAKQASAFLRPLLNIDIAKIKRWEKYYWRQADQLIVMSDRDKEFIVQTTELEKEIAVVANGVESDWFDEKPKKSHAKPTVLFVGTFKWLPNREAVRFLVHHIWPKILLELPEAELHIVGNAPTKEIESFADQYKNVFVKGRVEDIRDAFAVSDILVAPVFSGKGTRYKVLEAMASGTPLVATPTAVEGLELTPDEHVLLGSSADELAAQAVRLLRSKSLQQNLSEFGKYYVKKHFDWRTISAQLDILYRRIGAHNEKN
ncbi:MAG: glycosyltransferase [Candidatus Pacebacteria bacterium]|nr:glycosyltransferase [Candidatus Paceibacterota bacterium]